MLGKVVHKILWLDGCTPHLIVGTLFLPTMWVSKQSDYLSLCPDLTIALLYLEPLSLLGVPQVQEYVVAADEHC
jgi:hypothetical protein